jgi:hypothetical protein
MDRSASSSISFIDGEIVLLVDFSFILEQQLAFFLQIIHRLLD